MMDEEAEEEKPIIGAIRVQAPVTSRYVHTAYYGRSQLLLRVDLPGVYLEILD